MLRAGEEFFLHGKNLVTPERIQEGGVLIQKERIQEILSPREVLEFCSSEKALQGFPVIDAGISVILPGVIDTHVHINEPGRTEWEGFETATKAAAAGGITTLMDMPLNSIPVTTTQNALKEKIAAAENKIRVDCGFWGGLIPENRKELEPLVQSGVKGFKCFLASSGIPEFPPVTAEDLEKAMPILANLGIPLLVHAEIEDYQKPLLSSISGGKTLLFSNPLLEPQNPRYYSTYLRTHPKEMENDAIRLLIQLSRKTRCPVHIVHLSSAEGIPLILRAKEEDIPITAETCPHYLFFASEEIPEGHTEFKCSPPIREKENQDKLWEGLRKGVIDFIASDHSPCAPELKQLEKGDFLSAWGGISSLQFSLSAVWTQAKKRKFQIKDLAQWMCEAPAKLCGLEKQKGKIAKGYDADLSIWDPNLSFIVEPSRIFHKHPVTPYLSSVLEGETQRVFLRGKEIFNREASFQSPTGRALVNEKAYF